MKANTNMLVIMTTQWYELLKITIAGTPANNTMYTKRSNFIVKICDQLNKYDKFILFLQRG
jgi:hypothetical protein